MGAISPVKGEGGGDLKKEKTKSAHRGRGEKFLPEKGIFFQYVSAKAEEATPLRDLHTRPDGEERRVLREDREEKNSRGGWVSVYGAEKGGDHGRVLNCPS